MMNVSADAMATYERLRTEVMDGQARPQGLAAIVYHGMLRGLEILLSEGTPADSSSAVCAPLGRNTPLDQEFLHQVANLLLESQSQVRHVY